MATSEAKNPTGWAQSASLGLLVGAIPWVIGLAARAAGAEWIEIGWWALAALPLPASALFVRQHRRHSDAVAALDDTQRAAAHRERELLGRTWFARSVMDHAFEAVLIVGSDDRLMDANVAARTLFGISPEMVGGTPLSDLLPDLAADREAPLRDREEQRSVALHGDGSYFEVEVRSALLANGSAADLPWGRARLVMVREAPSRTVGARILKAAADLQRRQLTEARRQRGQILGLLAGGLRRHANALLARVVRPLDDGGHGLLEQIEQLETFALWERAGADATPGPVEVPLAVADALRPVEAVARRRNNRLVVSVAQTLDEIVADGVLFRSAVRILALIALHGRSDAAIRIAAAPDRTAGWIALTASDGRDRAEPPSGPLPDDRAAVATARLLASALGGHLTITRQAGGASCTLRLPADPVDAAPRPTADRHRNRALPASNPPSV